MKHTSIALALILAAGCLASRASTDGSATDQADGTILVVIAKDRVDDCRANGGCGLYSHSELLEMVKAAAELGAERACTPSSFKRL